MTEACSLTLSLGGRWYDSYGTAPCPVCQPERRLDQNALSISNGARGLLLHCKRSHCSFEDILTAAGLRLGRDAPTTLAMEDAKRHAEASRKEARARGIWEEAQPIGGTVAEAYLRGRGISCPLPATLRFHPACWHGPGQVFPAMVALVEGGGGFAVHRTYLRPDGYGKAPVEPAKKMLGSIAGGAVRLADWPGRLVVGEGIESTLSLACGLLDGPAALWAALSTSGMRGLRLPAEPGRLTIALDGDKAGRDNAFALAARADALGWAVETLDPGDGRDFNDSLMERISA